MQNARGAGIQLRACQTQSKPRRQLQSGSLQSSRSQINYRARSSSFSPILGRALRSGCPVSLSTCDTGGRRQAMTVEEVENFPPQFGFFTNPVKRCLSIFNTTPEFRSATSLTLYSAAVPSTCAVSEGVNL